MMNFEKAIYNLSLNWKNNGVTYGDTLLIHSSIKRTLLNANNKGLKIKPEHILESFKQAVGPKGTLLFPLFNFDFPKTKFFDLKNTQSQMGALTEAARLDVNSIRTGHPIYSFAVLGHKKNIFQGINNISGYGEDSPFGFLKKLGGKIVIIDLEDQNSMTFYHYIEEKHKVNYRHFKEFTGLYVDNYGNMSNRTYKLFVRKLEDGVKTHVNPTGELMWNKGLYKGDRPGIRTGMRIISANVMFDFVSDIIKNGNAEGMLFKYGRDE